jgi:hypothetical protein
LRKTVSTLRDDCRFLRATRSIAAQLSTPELAKDRAPWLRRAVEKAELDGFPIIYLHDAAKALTVRGELHILRRTWKIDLCKIKT